MFPYFLARLLGTPLRWLSGIFRSRIHGDARFMNRWERRRLLSPRHEGLVLGRRQRLSLERSFQNLALVAPTGMGKTTRYVIPNVLACVGSLVVTDPSGEIFRATAGRLEERGYRSQVFAPADLKVSCTFNPLAHWRTPQELRQLARILAGSLASPRSDPFWTTAAVNLLGLLLVAVAQVEDKRSRNLGNLRWLLNHVGGGEDTALDDFMARHLGRDHPRVFAEYRAFRAQDSRVLGSIVATARAAVELWADEDVARVTATNTVELTNLRRERTAIYLIVPEHQVRYFGLLLNLFYSACFTRCLQPRAAGEDLAVCFFLDEFGNLGRINDFASIITTLRKRRCSLSLILQDLAQLQATYGRDEARTIFSGGCANKLFFGGLDLETARYVEGLLGQNTEYDTTFGGIHERARTVGVPLMTADQVRRLGRAEAILVAGRERPVRLRTALTNQTMCSL